MIETNSVGRPAFLPEYQGDIYWRRVGGQGQPGLRTTVGGFYKHWIPSSIHHTRFPGAAIDRASRSMMGSAAATEAVAIAGEPRLCSHFVPVVKTEIPARWPNSQPRPPTMTSSSPEKPRRGPRLSSSRARSQIDRAAIFQKCRPPTEAASNAFVSEKPRRYWLSDHTAQVNLTARETTDTSGRSATAQHCDFGKKPGS